MSDLDVEATVEVDKEDPLKLEVNPNGVRVLSHSL